MLTLKQLCFLIDVYMSNSANVPNEIESLLKNLITDKLEWGITEHKFTSSHFNLQLKL